VLALKLLKHFLGFRMLRVLLEQLEKNISSLPAVALDGIDAREIQIGLVKNRGHPDALLESGDSFVAVIGPEKQDPQIVECFRIDRTGPQGAEKILFSVFLIICLGVDHPEVVARFCITWGKLQSLIE